MIVIERDDSGVPVVRLASDGRHDTRSGGESVTPLTDSEQDALILAVIRDGISTLRQMQADAAALIAASDAIRDSTLTAPAAYSQAALNQIISAVRGVASRQSVILRTLSGRVMDDLVGLGQLAAREIREGQ